MQKIVSAKYAIVFIILISILLGCKRDPLPRKAIKHDQFIAVLVDVHLAEAMYNERYRFKLDTIKTDAIYLSVLEKHQVTEEQMKITTLYYSRHPREYDKIYKEVLSLIDQKSEALNSKEEILVQ